MGCAGHVVGDVGICDCGSRRGELGWNVPFDIAGGDLMGGRRGVC